MERGRGIIKKLLIIMAALFVLTAQVCVWAANSNTNTVKERLSNAIVLHINNSKAFINNEEAIIDTDNLNVSPLIKDSKTLVPVRFISEALGAKVDWNGSTSTVIIGLKNNIVKMKINDKKVKINNDEKSMEVPAQIINGRTFLPLRSLVEALGKKVFWDNRGLIIISDKDSIINTKTESSYLNEIESWFNTDADLPLTEIASLDKNVVIVLTYDESGQPYLQGSGFCVGKGLFLTNYHVIEGGSSIKIITNDEKEYSIAGVVAFDENIDLALLKSEEVVPVSSLKIGSKALVEKGSKIVTIGSPKGLKNTVSEGIVSGLRTEDDVDLIQISAPITHGSSGGPLINMKGYVVGVNTLGLSSGELNFAVAIDHAKEWINDANSKDFQNIESKDIAHLLPKDQSIPDSELTAVIYNAMDAMEKENIKEYDKCIDTSTESYEESKVTLNKLFKIFDLKYNVEKVNVLAKTKEEAKLSYVYTVEKLKGPEFSDCRIEGRCILKNYNGKWKIYDASESIKEYLDDSSKGTSGSESSSSTNNSSTSQNNTEDTPVVKSFVNGMKLDNISVTNAVINPSKPVIYITDRSDKKLYSVNYETKKVLSLDLDLSPDRIVFSNNKLYITLLKGSHQYVLDESKQQGAVAIVNSEDLKLIDEFDVNIDPYDIVVDKDGYIYITGGSNQWTKVKSYSAVSKQEKASSGIRMQSYAVIHPTMNKFYTVDTDSSPRDIRAYNVDNGSFTDATYPGGYDSPYHGDYAMNTNIKISPDGKYIFNGAGTIFKCASLKADDIKFVSKLNKSYADIAFAIDKNMFFTIVDQSNIYAYNYSDFEGINTYKVNGQASNLFYQSDKIVAVSKINNAYGIEILNVK